MKKQLLLFPFNGNTIEALSFLNSEYEVLGFIDDNSSLQRERSLGYKIYSREALKKFPEAQVLAVPGSPTSYLSKKDIITSLDIPKERFPTIIHPDAKISNFASIGYNVLIMTNSIITSNAIIGNHVIVLPNTVIHHDCTIGDYCSIGSNIVIAGRTIIEENVYIGSGSNIINDITIGKKSLIGLGSVVTKSLPAESKVAGNPAKSI